jgi:hypothetical protein
VGSKWSAEQTIASIRPLSSPRNIFSAQASAQAYVRKRFNTALLPKTPIVISRIRLLSS